MTFIKHLNGQRELPFLIRRYINIEKIMQWLQWADWQQPKKKHLPATMKSTGTGEFVDKRHKKGKENIFLSNLIM